MGNRRAALASQYLGVRGALIQLKMDWEAMGNQIHLPRWDNTSGICFQCHCKKEDILQVEYSASWRHERIAPDALLGHLVAQGRSISPVWGFPLFTAESFKLDWLHCADQGVTAMFMGALLVMCICNPGFQMYGATQEIRRACIWQMIQCYYRSEKILTDRMKCLPSSRFHLKPPKLKAMGGTIRRLVGFFLQFTQQWTRQGEELSQQQQWALEAMKALSQCYACLSHTSGLDPSHLKEQSILFAIHLKQLHYQSPEVFCVRPKLHQWLELCSSGIIPSDVWNYREEDFGGSLASMAMTEGGLTTSSSCSRVTLQKFCIRQVFPTMVNVTAQSSN